MWGKGQITKDEEQEAEDDERRNKGINAFEREHEQWTARGGSSESEKFFDLIKCVKLKSLGSIR